MDKVVKYVRVPVKNQKEILEEQQKELMQYAEERGFEVAEVGILCKKTGEVEQLNGLYADEGNYVRDTKTTRGREAFWEMIIEALEGKCNQIIVEDTIILSRLMNNQMEIMKTLRNHGINIHFIKEEIDTIDPSNDETLEELFRVAEKEINGKKIEQNQ